MQTFSFAFCPLIWASVGIHTGTYNRVADLIRAYDGAQPDLPDTTVTVLRQTFQGRVPAINTKYVRDRSVGKRDGSYIPPATQVWYFDLLFAEHHTLHQRLFFALSRVAEGEEAARRPLPGYETYEALPPVTAQPPPRPRPLPPPPRPLPLPASTSSTARPTMQPPPVRSDHAVHVSQARTGGGDDGAAHRNSTAAAQHTHRRQLSTAADRRLSAAEQVRRNVEKWSDFSTKQGHPQTPQELTGWTTEPVLARVRFHQLLYLIALALLLAIARAIAITSAVYISCLC